MNINSSELRPGQARPSQFLHETKRSVGRRISSIFACVCHVVPNSSRQPLQVCCKDLFDQLGPATFIPIQ